MPRKTKEISELKELKTEKLDKQKKAQNTRSKSKTQPKVSSKTKSALNIEKKSKAKSDLKTETKKNMKSKAKSVASSTNALKTVEKKDNSSKSKNVSKAKSKTNTRLRKSPLLTSSVEYYDLPFKYNETVVKILYQNPTTLFVYWEISDEDVNNYKKLYGENFFDTTRPVLIVYNDTMNYKFEIDINDFANSWYFNIKDSKCDYRVELIRKPITYNENIKSDYIFISSSNIIESPNDRILFSTDEPSAVYFRNTKNNNRRKVNLLELLEHLNLSNKDFGFPIIKNIYDLYKHIYKVNDVREVYADLANPSSGNPSSHSLSSRFK